MRRLTCTATSAAPPNRFGVGSAYSNARLPAAPALARPNKEVALSAMICPGEMHVREWRPGSARAALMAGLPHLLTGLLISAGKLGLFDRYPVPPTAIIGIAGGLALAVLGVLAFAWRAGWPLWSASWYLYGTCVPLLIFGIAIESLNLDRSYRYTNALFVAWMLLCIVGYFVIISRSKLHGLLSVAALFPLLAVSMLEFIPNPVEGWLTIGVGLAMALAAYGVVRAGTLGLGLAVVLGLNQVVGIAWAYVSEYRMLDLPAGIPAHVPRLDRFFQVLAFYSAFGLGIVALPFVLHGLSNLARRRSAA